MISLVIIIGMHVEVSIQVVDEIKFSFTILVQSPSENTPFTDPLV